MQGESEKDMVDRKKAYEHLQTVGNWIENEQTGRSVERVDMIGGEYLTFDETGDVAGFKNFSGCMEYLGIL